MAIPKNVMKRRRRAVTKTSGASGACPEPGDPLLVGGGIAGGPDFPEQDHAHPLEGQRLATGGRTPDFLGTIPRLFRPFGRLEQNHLRIDPLLLEHAELNEPVVE